MSEQVYEMLADWKNVKCSCDASVGWVCVRCYDIEVVANHLREYRTQAAEIKRLRKALERITLATFATKSLEWAKYVAREALEGGGV